MSSTEDFHKDLPALLIAGLFDTLWLTNRRRRLLSSNETHKQLRHTEYRLQSRRKRMSSSSGGSGGQYEIGVQSFTYREFNVPDICSELSGTGVSAIELCDARRTRCRH